MQPTPLRDRLLAGAGSAAVLALTGYTLLLNPSSVIVPPREADTTLLALHPTPPPPPPRVRHVERPTARKPAHRPAPPNLRDKATDLVRPPPPIVPAPPPPVVTAARPSTGMAASSGASDRPGPGEGAGGEGSGTGGGGSGGEGDTPPRYLKGRLRFADLPPDIRARGVGGTVGVRYHVEVNRRVTGCTVIASSGNARIDATTCQLIEQRFRYAPSRDADGRPVRSTIVENHSFIIDRGSEADGRLREPE